MKKIVSCLAAAGLFAAAVFCCPAQAAGLPALSARSAVLLDAESGRVLYALRPEEESLIASTTKIMTGLLIAQQCSPDSSVQIPSDATGIEGSSLYLKAGEILSVRELMYGLLLHSGNDAAMALALFCAGSEEEFVCRMNDKARQLGLTHTHFANPHGLDSEGNYSTALDLARLTDYALENDLFREICATRSVTIGERRLTNHNKLLWRYDGAIGVKTGYTKAAGRILVSAAERDGRRLIAVTLNAPRDWEDHTALLDYGFSAFTPTPLLTAGACVAEIPVLSGAGQTAAVCAEEGLSYPLTPEESAVLRLHLPRFVFAPVEKGTLAGWAEVCIRGETLYRRDLYWMEDIPAAPESRSGLSRLWKRG